MLKKDQKFETPPWNTIIWRYMSFEKFLDIIIEDHLFFTNVAQMTDKNECEIPRKNHDLLWRQDHRMCVRMWNDFNDLKRGTFINCWIMNRFESYALWKIYLSGSKTGVAIKTNVKNLVTAINENSNPNVERIYLGKVNYSDFIKDELTISKLVTTKNHYYNFENEVRLIILKDQEIKQETSHQYEEMKDGLHINLDPTVLIDEIYLSPFCGAYFQNIFESTIHKIKPQLVSRIKKSEIKDS
jgi:hypothetical protein